ncbi:hypothetical protein IQ07DRAFT_133397 [Pyrenochaeta sp. DS3sAY3a]|nr:hypothetical protein IQ07DRAFT_133397 [Pyrenochaeta sp. DS3sAY3a]
MASAHNYTRLPDVRETQDIADANQDSYDTHSILQRLDSDIELRPLSFSTSADSNEIYQRAPANRASLETIDTFDSPSSSGFSKGKIKNFAARIRRKPLPNNLFGSIRRHPAADIQPTRIGPGVWKDQLLVDRSLRTMAATMTLFAVAMIILIATHAKFFSNRSNRNTSSVGGDTGSCETVTTRNTVFLLLINVCATMILGMSNTYQQLVTSLKVSDLKHMLSEFGDSRVGTNSPFNINHKREGKKSAWASWVFLILTSMPIHFLANSLIGPSYVQELPDIVEFNEVNNLTWASARYDALGGSYEEVISSDMSFPCWAAFRTGKPHYPQSTEILESYNGPFGSQQDQFGKNWKRIQVHYDRVNCSQHARTASDLFALERDLKYAAYGTYYAEGNCELGANVLCTLTRSRQSVASTSV